MLKRIPNYSDAFIFYNKISSFGSYISIFSLIIFIYVLVGAFIDNGKQNYKPQI